MADIHVLDRSTDGACRVVFHFPVPDAMNAVGVSYRAALVASGIGGSTVLPEGTGPGQITTAEKSQIEAGEVYEDPRTLRRGMLESGGTEPAQLKATLRQFYGQQKQEHLQQVAARLMWFGHTESEA